MSAIAAALVVERAEPVNLAYREDLPEDTGIRPYRWTSDELFTAAEKGALRNPERLVLLDEDIIEQVSPQLTAHSQAILLTRDALQSIVMDESDVRAKLPK
jgi:hypothetical protein